MAKIGFGGGCHWCTEAVFQAVDGVEKVEQGWISSIAPNTSPSEAVVIHFDAKNVSTYRLIQIHLHTHSATSNHSMRTKYRSAIYYFNETQKLKVQQSISQIQLDFEQKIITSILSFHSFKLNDESFLNYYQKNREAPFCKTYIEPKLKALKGL